MNIPIVNEQDEVITMKERKGVGPDDIYRVSALWLKNSKGEFLLARRAFSKSHDPGKWGPAVAGTVEENETYETNIVKEIFEELGLKDLPLQPGPKVFIQGKHKFFDQWFAAVADLDIQDFTISQEEVAEIAWFSLEEYRKLITEKPEQFIPSMKDVPSEFIQR
jgi:isopentenyl-diphosphate delta-isomerase